MLAVAGLIAGVGAPTGRVGFAAGAAVYRLGRYRPIVQFDQPVHQGQSKRQAGFGRTVGRYVQFGERLEKPFDFGLGHHVL